MGKHSPKYIYGYGLVCRRTKAIAWRTTDVASAAVGPGSRRRRSESSINTTTTVIALLSEPAQARPAWWPQTTALLRRTDYTDVRRDAAIICVSMSRGSAIVVSGGHVATSQMQWRNMNSRRAQISAKADLVRTSKFNEDQFLVRRYITSVVQ